MQIVCCEEYRGSITRWKAEKIKKHIATNNSGVNGLGVNFSKGVVSLSGQAAGAEVMEKAVLLAGNVRGVNKTRALAEGRWPSEGFVQWNEPRLTKLEHRTRRGAEGVSHA